MHVSEAVCFHVHLNFSPMVSVNPFVCVYVHMHTCVGTNTLPFHGFIRSEERGMKLMAPWQLCMTTSVAHLW